MSQAISDMSVTWADGTLKNGIKLNVTDTSSNASSLLMDLGTGGGSFTSRFKVDKNGNFFQSSPLTGSTLYGWYPYTNPANGSLHTNPGFGGIVFDTTATPTTTSGTVWLTPSGVRVVDAGNFSWTSGGTVIGAADLILARDAANTLAQRNGANAQAFRLYGTYTDTSNYRRLALTSTTAGVFTLSADGLGTGLTGNSLAFATDGVARLTIAADGAATFVGQINAGQSNAIRFNNSTTFFAPSDGVLRLSNAATNDFGRLQFGGTTSSFPALKRSTTSLQARLADDSAFTNIQGKLTTETAYAATAPTPTGYLVLYDSTGTAYKVPAEAL